MHTRRLGIAAAGALALGAGYASGAQTLAASPAPAPATSRLPTGQQAPSSTKTQPQQTPPPTGTQPAGPQPPPPPPQREPKKTAPVRYRIVGCRSSGASPYYHGPSYSRRVAVGFDDGPAALTPAFVTMLERKRVQATFFLIGQQVTATYRPTLLRELRDGDVLGDHSFTHPDLAASGGAYGQLRSTIQAIRAQTGYTPCLFRPPYGAYDQALVSTARSLGLATVLWNVDPTDWALPGTSAIEARVLAQVQPGSIVLSHDGGGPRGQTLAAYGSIINKLRARGYRIVTIPELLGFRPVYVPCVRLCEGIGVTRRELPRDAVIQRAP